MKKVILKGLSVFIFSFFFVFHFVSAQTVGTASIDGIDISASPANPSPGANVTVSVESYSTDISAALISWTINGKTLTKGSGLESITVIAPAVGKTLQIVANINTVAGASIKKLISINSGDVDIVWETGGYVPPLYEGKTPFTYQSTLTFIAMPHLKNADGTDIDPKNLVYQWKENTFVLGSLSGYGKQSVQIKGSVIAQPIKIDVTVSSADGSARAEKELTLQPIAPSIIFYQDDPLYGILYNNAIAGTLQLFHNQTKVIAAPYGFNIPGDAFTYNWSINGAAQSALSSSRSVILGVNPGQQGSSNVDLTLQNTGDDILQSADAAFTAVFSGKAATATTSAVF